MVFVTIVASLLTPTRGVSPACLADAAVTGTPLSTTGVYKDLTFGMVDNDGLGDVVGGASTGVVWWRNTGALGFAAGVSISSSQTTWVELVDMDGDMDLDVVAAGSQSNVEWHANDGSGAFSLGDSSTIVGVAEPPLGMAVGDVDGDTGPDIMVAFSYRGLFYHPNPGNGVLGTPVPFAQSYGYNDISGSAGVSLGDVDNDNDLDVVVASLYSGLRWIENSDGAGTFPGPNILIDALSGGAVRTLLVDLDADSMLDIVVWGESQSKLGFVLNENDAASWGPFTPLSGSLVAATDVWVADVDGDAILDILAVFAGDNTIAYFQSLGPGNGYGNEALVLNGDVASARAVVTGDADGDGDQDIFVASSETGARVVLYPNEPLSAAEYGPDDTFSVGDIGDPVATLAADLDGDGDKDVVVAGTNAVTSGVFLRWYMNTDGRGSFGPARAVLAVVAHSMASADVDGDGDIDLALGTADGLRWAVNTDGLGTFAPGPIVIDGCCSSSIVFDLQNADMDRDGAMDMVAARGNNLVWYRGAFLNSGFAPLETELPLFVGTAAALQTLAVADLTSDGWFDVVGSTPTTDGVFLYIHPGTPSLSSMVSETLIGPSVATPTDVTLADLDGDGFTDLVVASDTAGLLFFANTGGDGNLPSSILVNSVSGVRNLVAGDVDNDGDADLVMAGLSSWGSIAWLANDGSGTFAPIVRVSNTLTLATALSVHDIDNDGDLDFIAGAYYATTVLWVRNRRRSIFTSTASVTRSVLATGGACASPFSATCIAEVVERSSLCGAKDVLLLEPGTYDCPSLAHIPVVRDVVVRARIPGTVTFDCGLGTTGTTSVGGVLFRVMENPDQSAQVPRGSLTLEGLTLAHMGVARASLFGSPGLRVEGGSSLTLLNSTITSSVSNLEVTFSLVDQGVGGAVLAASGGNLTVVDSVVDQCSASDQGGALAARGTGSSITLVGSTISQCTAGASGGGVVATEGATLDIRSSDLSGNTAQKGSGGGVAVTLAGSISMEDSRVISNLASFGVGGGLFVEPSSPSSLTNVVISNNRAPVGAGGGLFVRPTSTLSVSFSVLERNQAILGGAFAVYPDALDGETRVASAENLAASASSSGIDAIPAGPGGPSLDLIDTECRDNTASAYGGGGYVCAAAVGVQGAGTVWESNLAERGGLLGSSNDVLLCASSDGLPLGFTPDVSAGAPGLPWIRIEPALRAPGGALANAALHTPPTEFRLVEVPARNVSVGQAMGGSFRGVDWLGSYVSFANVGPRLRFSNLPPEVPEPGTLLLREGPTRFPLTNLVAASVEGVLPTVGWSLGVEQRSGALEIPSLTGSVMLGECGAGFGLTSVSESVSSAPYGFQCTACAAGTFSLVASLAPCTPVKSCLSGSVILDANAVSSGNTTLPCECLPGFYFVSTDVDGYPVCDPCPRGGVCLRGLGAPTPAPGFYGVAEDAFVACKRPAACPGRVDRSCTAGYEGYMCNTCADGYYSNSNTECVKCPPAAVGTFASVLVFGLVICAGIAVLVAVGVLKSQPRGGRGGGEEEEDGKGGDESPRTRAMPASVGMIVVVAQVLGILANAKFEWGSSSRSALGVFNVANVDVNLFASECSLSSFHAKYTVSVLLPIGIVVAVAGSMAVLRVLASSGVVLSGLARLSIRTLLDSVVFSVAPLLYIPMSRSTFLLFDCSKLPNGDLVLDADPGVACFDGAWWSVAWVGVLGLVTYVFGIPAYFLWCMVRRRHTLMEPETYARYGSLYKLYRVVYFWGGVADLGKRLAIVVAAIFVSDRQLIQIGLLLLVFGSCVAALLYAQPYFYPLYNSLDLQLTLILVFLLLLGAASYAESGRSGNSEDAIFVVVVCTLCLFAVVAIRAVFIDFRQIIRERKVQYSARNDRKLRFVSFAERELEDLGGSDAGHVRRMVEALTAGGGSGGVEGVEMMEMGGEGRVSGAAVGGGAVAVGAGAAAAGGFFDGIGEVFRNPAFVG